MVDILPYFLFNILPRFSPKNVNNKLVTENIKADIKYLLIVQIVNILVYLKEIFLLSL